MIHYELIILYQLGFKPVEVIKRFGYQRAIAYRFYRIYCLARQRAKDVVCGDFSVSSGEKNTQKG